jgi:hypothetical protein
MNPLNSVRGAITTGVVIALIVMFLIAPTGFQELSLARWLRICRCDVDRTALVLQRRADRRSALPRRKGRPGGAASRNTSRHGRCSYWFLVPARR